MAKIPKVLSWHALEIKTAMDEGRTEDGKTIAIELLMKGKADPDVQRLVAAILRPPKKAKGRPSSNLRHWLEIGQAFEAEREDGLSHEDALVKIEKIFGYGQTHIEKAVRMYRDAKAAHDASTQEVQESDEVMRHNQGELSQPK